MIDMIFSYIAAADDSLWSYIGFPLIVVIGLIISLRSRFFQIRRFFDTVRNFYALLSTKSSSKQGVHPMQAFFACVGGCMGIGNIVGVCAAVQIGGPGAMFWVWVTATFGMILKYGEIYLGMRFRVPNPAGGHLGGPMYYLSRAFKQAWVPSLVCLLLAVYGIEIFQFSVMTNSVSQNFGFNHLAVTVVFLLLVLITGRGGVGLVGTICSWIIPIFFVLYFCMGLWVCLLNYDAIPQVLADVFIYAFTPHAVVSGTAGGLLITISQGIRRGCYSSDVGIGYASVIHSESSTQQPERQASLAIIDVFLDAFLVCTMSMMIILVTGHWERDISATQVVQTALADYFPHMDIFMPSFLVLLGYSTVIAYFCFGLTCAEFLGGTKGRKFYYVYGALSLFAFSFVNDYQALIVMSVTQLALIILNLWGMYRLRHEISFALVLSQVGETAGDVELAPNRRP